MGSSTAERAPSGMTRAGTPTRRLQGGATVPSSTTAPAPTIEWSPISHPIRTTALAPRYTKSPMTVCLLPIVRRPSETHRAAVECV